MRRTPGETTPAPVSPETHPRKYRRQRFLKNSAKRRVIIPGFGGRASRSVFGLSTCCSRMSCVVRFALAGAFIQVPPVRGHSLTFVFDSHFFRGRLAARPSAPKRRARDVKAGVGQTRPREPAVGAWLLCLHCSGRSRARMRVKDDRAERSAGVIRSWPSDRPASARADVPLVAGGLVGSANSRIAKALARTTVM